MPRGFAQAVGLSRVVSGFERLRDQVGGDAVYLVGSNVEYAVYLEFGTSKMPAYPWLRPAVSEFERNPRKFIETHTNTTIDALDSADAVVEAVALALERRMTDNVTAGDKSPEADPDHPVRQTGNLAGSIKAVKV